MGEGETTWKPKDRLRSVPWAMVTFRTPSLSEGLLPSTPLPLEAPWAGGGGTSAHPSEQKHFRDKRDLVPVITTPSSVWKLHRCNGTQGEQVYRNTWARLPLWQAGKAP